MSALIQLLEPLPYQAGLEKEENNSKNDQVSDNVIAFETQLQQQLKQAMAQIEQLRTEQATLRTELAQAERALGYKNLLLLNAGIRERCLREQLAARFL